ncbi:MAG: hypothetical protein ACRDY3_05720 [Acidimicrobiales bacterium]
MRARVALGPLDAELARKIAVTTAATRAVIGLVAVAVPGAVTRPWVGSSGRPTGTGVLGRAFGGRDLALGLGVLLADRHGRPVRGWVEAGALADLVDAGATLADFGRLPRVTRDLVLATAAGAATAGLLAARAV